MPDYEGSERRMTPEGPTFADLFAAIDGLRKEVEAWRTETVTHSELAFVVKASEEDRKRLGGRIESIETFLRDKADHSDLDNVRQSVSEVCTQLDANDRLTQRLFGALVFVSVTIPVVIFVIQWMLNGKP